MSSKPRSGDGTLLAVAALLWAIGTGLAFLVVPSSTAESASVSSSPASVSTPPGYDSAYDAGTQTTEVKTTTTHETLLEAEGASVLVLLLIPVAVTLAGALARGRRKRGLRLVTGVTLTVMCLLGAMSLGLFYAPAAVLLLVAGFRTPVPGGRSPVPL